jgi:hypothetical protein
MKTLAIITAAILVSGTALADIDDFVSAAPGEDSFSLYTDSEHDSDHDSDRNVSAPEVGSSDGESLIDQFTSGAD